MVLQLYREGMELAKEELKASSKHFSADHLPEVMADLLMLLGEKLPTQVSNFKKARPIMESFKTSKRG